MQTVTTIKRPTIKELSRKSELMALRQSSYAIAHYIDGVDSLSILCNCYPNIAKGFRSESNFGLTLHIGVVEIVDYGLDNNFPIKLFLPFTDSKDLARLVHSSLDYEPVGKPMKIAA